MKFNLLKNKEKSKTNIANSNTNDNKKTREKFILKGWIESNRKTTCTKKGTRGFLFGSQTPSKMDFAMQSISGRSMVEMLGVLAIIGVLSIGGIQGYTIAMRKHRANEIISVMQKYAIILYTRCMNANLNESEELIALSTHTSNQSDSYFLGCPDPITFEEAGIGGLPSGVNKIIYLPDEETRYWGLWNIIRTNSGDIVRFYVSFESKELCQTVLNAAGIVPVDDQGYKNGSTVEGDCVNGGYMHEGLLSFMMN